MEKKPNYFLLQFEDDGVAVKVNGVIHMKMFYNYELKSNFHTF